MTLYSLFEPPADADRSAQPAVVADRFSPFAFWLPPAYMLMHRLWLALVVYVAAVLALVLLAPWLGQGATLLIYGVLAVAIGFEAASLRRAKLRRRGFRYGGEVVAAQKDLAELEWLRSREFLA